MPALIDDFLPSYSVCEYHSLDVRAPAPHVYAQLRTTNFLGSPAVRRLFWLRRLPGRAFGRSPGSMCREVTVDTFLRSGAIVLAENPAEELLIGLVGQFWKPFGRNERVDRLGFRQFDRAGYAKTVINFSLTQKTDRLVTLGTETRVLCLDRTSRRAFGLYWLLIAPFSGYIRRQMLWAIKESSERGMR